MNLAADRLEAHLAGGLSPIYLITGDDPLLTGEALDAVRARARSDGYTDRTVFQVDRYFDWHELSAASSAMSLFAERQLIELRLPTGKPGDAGGKALRAYAASPSPDAVLLIAAGKIDKRSLSSAWAGAIDQAGVIVQVWPIDRTRLPQWIGRRLKAVGLDAGPDVARLIADRVEGNLLAADQEVRKLALLLEPGKIGEDDVLRAVADSARYDVFQLVDAATGGDLRRAQRVLDGLEAEGGTVDAFEGFTDPLVECGNCHRRFRADLPEAERLALFSGHSLRAGLASHAEADEVAAEWTDRYGDVPAQAQTLVDIARLRVEALRIGLTEIVKLRNEVRMGPVDLSDSQEIRLKRLARGSVLNAKEATIFIPAPSPLLPGLLDFMAEMWPAEP